MKFQILEIVLWPRNPEHPARRLYFKPGQINIITGSSKTGKSSVIPIIDYCLGSERCAIPVSTIRDSCSWFGILIETEEGQKLLARREPGEQQSTNDMLLLESALIKLPELTPVKNTTVDAVKRTLDRLSGLSNLSFDPSGLAGGFKGRPSFRDMTAFVFQPQNIVANPDVLFYKADTTEHREKLKTIFPYVLGAMTPDTLAKRWEIEQIQRDIRRLEREVFTQLQATERWKAELISWISEARQLGLVPDEQKLDTTKESELINTLRNIVTKSSRDTLITGETIEHTSREASELDREESVIALQLSEVRARMENMIRLRETVDDYTNALDKQRERLWLSRWLRDQAQDTSCPICGGNFSDARHDLDQLCDSLAMIEASSRKMQPVPAAFDHELIQVRQEVRVYTDQLRAVNLRRRRLEEQDRRLQEEARQRSRVDRFLGRAEQALSMFASPKAHDEEQINLNQLKSRLEVLRSGVSEVGIQSRINAALKSISALMSRLLPSLDAERPEDPVELNIEDLTIRVTGSTGRADYLWEIGSGANWLSYHIASTLALHWLFFKQAASPVPGMIVYDQPSQVYFPQTLARTPSVGTDPQLRDEDLIAVRSIFKTLGKVVNASNSGLQVIVLDHAGPDVWKGLEGIHLVEEWRDGRALVPKIWLE